MFGEAPDGAAFASGVAPLEDHGDAAMAFLHPALQLDQFDLQLLQLRFVLHDLLEAAHVELPRAQGFEHGFGRMHIEQILTGQDGLGKRRRFDQSQSGRREREWLFCCTEGGSFHRLLAGSLRRVYSAQAMQCSAKGSAASRFSPMAGRQYASCGDSDKTAGAASTGHCASRTMRSVVLPRSASSTP